MGSRTDEDGSHQLSMLSTWTEMVDELWVNIGNCRTCWFWNLFLLRTFLKQTWPSCLHCRTQSFQIFGFHKYFGERMHKLWKSVRISMTEKFTGDADVDPIGGRKRPGSIALPHRGMNGHLGTREVSLLHYVQAACHAPTSSLWSLWNAFCLCHFASAPRIFGVGKCKLRSKVLASKLTTCAQSKCCCYEEDSCRLLVLLEVMAWAAFVCIVLIFRPTSAQCFSYGFVFRSPATQGYWKSEEEDVLQRHQDHSKAWLSQQKQA